MLVLFYCTHLFAKVNCNLDFSFNFIKGAPARFDTLFEAPTLLYHPPLVGSCHPELNHAKKSSAGILDSNDFVGAVGVLTLKIARVDAIIVAVPLLAALYGKGTVGKSD